MGQTDADTQAQEHAQGNRHQQKCTETLKRDAQYDKQTKQLDPCDYHTDQEADTDGRTRQGKTHTNQYQCEG